VKEESRPRDSAPALQLPLFVQDTVGYSDAIARYEAIRPILKGEQSLRQQSQQTGMNYWRLWRDLRRFRRDGLLGLIDRRTLPHARGKPGADVFLPRHIQQLIVRLALAHPCTACELARIIRDGYHYPVAHRGIQRVLARHHLSPEALQRHRHRAQQTPSPPWPPGNQLGLPFEPAAHAQRLEQALGPEHLLIRFRTYREYPTDEQARGRIIEWLELGFRPRRVAALLAIDPHVVYSWQRRFKAAGLLGLSTRPRAHTSISTRVPVQVIMEVFQLLDNNPLLGHYRVKMALDSSGTGTATRASGSWWPSTKRPIPPRHRTNAHQIPTNVPSTPRLPIRSGTSMCGIWSRSRGIGSTVSSCSTATVGRLWARAVSTARTSPAWSKSAARRSRGGVRLRPSSAIMPGCFWH
jgi:Homeodomain-like domain/leucine-zipper of insertion element IS481